MVEQLLMSTKDVRDGLSTDMTSLQAELDPKIAALRAGLENHIKEYISTAKEVMTEQMTKQSALMQEMQPKWGPVLEKLRAGLENHIKEYISTAKEVMTE